MTNTEYGPALELRNIVSNTFERKHNLAKGNEEEWKTRFPFLSTNGDLYAKMTEEVDKFPSEILQHVSQTTDKLYGNKEVL